MPRPPSATAVSQYLSASVSQNAVRPSWKHIQLVSKIEPRKCALPSSTRYRISAVEQHKTLFTSTQSSYCHSFLSAAAVLRKCQLRKKFWSVPSYLPG